MTNQMLSRDKPFLAQLTERLSWIAVIIVLALAVVTNALAPILALNWTRNPFLGVLLEHTLVVAGRSAEDWSGLEAGLEHPDRIIGVDGVPVFRGTRLVRELRKYEPGDRVTLDVEGRNPSGGWATRQVGVTLMQFPLKDLVSRFFLPYVVGLIYLALGIWVFAVKGNRSSGRSFALFCAFLSMLTASYFDLISSHGLTPLFTLAVPFVAAAVVHLGLVFPQERTLFGRWRVLHYLPYIPAAIVTVWGEAVLYNAADPRAYFVPWRWGFYYAGLGILVFSALLFWTRFRPASPEIRQQVRIILTGVIAAFLPLSVGWYWIPFSA